MGDKSINITLQDADGKLIQALNGQMLVQPLPDGAPTLVSQVINFDAITFPRFGRYEFRIQIDDYPEVCIPLTVVRVRVA